MPMLSLLLVSVLSCIFPPITYQNMLCNINTQGYEFQIAQPQYCIFLLIYSLFVWFINIDQSCERQRQKYNNLITLPN
jgi:hypothetical protein